MAGILYMVATPIGNLSDITIRALEVLKTVDVIVCEDTRVSQKLLKHYEINKPFVSCHHHSAPRVYSDLVQRLLEGQSLAYISDAGTPGIADPGGKLVAIVKEEGIRVVPIPGASAVTSILSVAGVHTNSYIFLGFPPHKKGRQTFFKQVASCEYPVVFFESTHRIEKALVELGHICPDRQMVVGRELTKQFETIYRGFPAEVLEQIKATSSKGEFVLLVSTKNY